MYYCIVKKKKGTRLNAFLFSLSFYVSRHPRLFKYFWAKTMYQKKMSRCIENNNSNWEFEIIFNSHN